MNTDKPQTETNTMLHAVPSWEDFEKANPHKPYEQSEKYGNYRQRMVQHYNNLYAQWLELSRHSM